MYARETDQKPWVECHTHTHTLYMYSRLWLELSFVFFAPPNPPCVYHQKVYWQTCNPGCANMFRQRLKQALSIFVISVIFAQWSTKQSHISLNAAAFFISMRLHEKSHNCDVRHSPYRINFSTSDHRTDIVAFLWTLYPVFPLKILPTSMPHGYVYFKKRDELAAITHALKKLYHHLKN